MSLPGLVWSQVYTVTLGDWLPANDATLLVLNPGQPWIPIYQEEPVKEPDYQFQTPQYGLMTFGYDGDATRDDFQIIVKDVVNGREVFYFDANNDEDLTNDPGPFTWSQDSLLWNGKKYAPILEISYSFPPGFTAYCTLIPLDEQGRMEVQRMGYAGDYFVIMHNTRYGTWSREGENISVAALNWAADGNFNGESENDLMLVDIDRDGVLSSEERIPLRDGGFDYDDVHYRAHVTTEGDVLVIEGTDTEVHVPDLSLNFIDMEGNSWRLYDLAGKVTVLNFWYVACGPCRIEIPRLNDLVQSYKDEEVVFLAYALNGPAALEDYFATQNFDYTVLPDAARQADNFRIVGYPTHIVLDSEGKVIARKGGASEHIDENLRIFIDQALHP
ncbi:TlpA family protein disulfide reductase [Candidatus Neomarinimicrobiota bacterium]